MAKVKELSGQRFTKLTVIKRAGSTKYGQPLWECKCDCGNTTFVCGQHLREQRVKSCGCYIKEIVTKHKMSRTRLYKIWASMKNRCENPNRKDYKRYGQRGIKVCSDWSDFLTFCEWATNNGYNDGLTLDRIDVNGNYEPSNCRWATVKEQSNNRTNNHLITYNGETKTIAQWAEERNINHDTLYSRINRMNWDIGRALGYEC